MGAMCTKCAVGRARPSQEVAAQELQTGESTPPTPDEMAAERERELENQAGAIARRQAARAAGDAQALLAAREEKQRLSAREERERSHARWKEQQVEDACSLIYAMQSQCAPTAVAFPTNGQVRAQLHVELASLNLDALRARALQNGVGAAEVEASEHCNRRQGRTAREGLVALIVERESLVASETPEVEPWPDLQLSKQLSRRPLPQY